MSSIPGMENKQYASANYNPNMPYNPVPKRKSGCGCCGCFTGCLILLLLPPLIFGILFFTLDLGEKVDEAMIYSYYQYGRPAIIQAFDAKMSESERKQSMEVLDSYVEAYHQLPKEDRRLVRKEALVYLFYSAQGKEPPPEKVSNFMRFFDAHLNQLKQKYMAPPGGSDTVH